MFNDDELKEWLRPVQDPELFLSLIDLGLIYGFHQEVLSENGEEFFSVDVDMTLTSPGCPASDSMIHDVKQRLLEHPKIKQASVKIVWTPAWDPKTMASDEVKDRMGIW